MGIITYVEFILHFSNSTLVHMDLPECGISIPKNHSLTAILFRISPTKSITSQVWHIPKIWHHMRLAMLTLNSLMQACCKYQLKFNLASALHSRWCVVSRSKVQELHLPTAPLLKHLLQMNITPHPWHPCTQCSTTVIPTQSLLNVPNNFFR